MNWQLKLVEHSKQPFNDGSNCGIFVCKFFDCLINSIDLDFDPQRINEYRKTIAETLMNRKEESVSSEENTSLDETTSSEDDFCLV